MCSSKKIKNKISLLRALMEKTGIDAFLITHDDEYLLENTHKSNQRLKWIIGFSGSAGFLVVSKLNLYLFVDGRYTLQSKIETKGIKVKILNINEVINFNYFNDKAEKIKNFGVYTKSLSYDYYYKLFSNAKEAKINIVNLNINLIDQIWKRNTKKQKTKKIFTLEKKYCDVAFSEKISQVKKYISKEKADGIFIQNSESIAWLLNIRGSDLDFTPITLSHAIILKNKVYVFLENTALEKKIVNYYSKKIFFIEITKITSVLKKFKNKKFNILLDPFSTSKYYYDLIKKYTCKCILIKDPVSNLKSIKTTSEIRNITSAHLLDGISLCKFLYWLKNINYQISELDIVKKIDTLRERNKYFLCKSFPTIAGSGPNGAIIHYIPNKKTNRKILKNDIILVDSGGQYKLGTTDVTRTVSIGKPTKNQILNYTLVLKGHINFSTARFPEGVTGAYLDYLARAYLWKEGKDYSHGTGHGVGYCLNVHEGPFSISRFNNIPLKNGMVFSNEPGYYLEKKYGIRIENLVSTKSIIINGKNFLNINTLTLAPYDNDLIDISMLSKEELNWLNDYNKNLYQKLKPYLLEKERNWLYNNIKKK